MNKQMEKGFIDDCYRSINQSINQSMSLLNSYRSQDIELHEQSKNTTVIGIFK